MRNYIFRGIATENYEWEGIEGEKFCKGEFTCGQLVFNKSECYIVGELIEATDEYIAPEYWIPVDPKTIGQFTEYFDDDKVPVYEGDVIWSGGEEWIVIFKNGCFRGSQIKNIAKERNIGYLAMVGIKVIRNIHEVRLEELI